MSRISPVGATRDHRQDDFPRQANSPILRDHAGARMVLRRGGGRARGGPRGGGPAGLESPMAIVTPELLAQHGLSEGEYERIRKALGRDPNLTELGLFSVMW